MTSRADDADRTPWRKTACILCENNCGLEVQVDGRAFVRIRGDADHPSSAGYTCEKAMRLDHYQSDPHRLTTPLRRRSDGTHEPIDWDTALDEISSKLLAIRDEHGGERILFHGGGGQGNHLGGAYGRAMHQAVGGRYLSNALSQEKTSEGFVDEQLSGTHTSADVARAQVAVFVGKNPWQTHGLARARVVLREIARDPARTLIVVDPRRSETAEMADIHLQLRPGTDAWCMSAIVAVLVQEDLLADEWLRQHAVGADLVVTAFREIDIADHARRCGVPEALLRTAARRIAAADGVATWEDLGVQHSPNATLVSYLIKLLWVLTGNFAKPGGMQPHSWVFPAKGRWHPVRTTRGRRLRTVKRVTGAAAMRFSAAPTRLGLAVAARSRVGRRVADVVAGGALGLFFDGVATPTAQRIADVLSGVAVTGTTPVTGAPIIDGLMPCNTIADEILTDHPARLRAIWVDGSNPAHSMADSARFARAMDRLELSVVVDVSYTETARHADYVLPAASQFEKHEASLFTHQFPRNVFHLRQPVLPPLAGTRPEPEIYAAIIDRLGVVEPQLLKDLTAAATVSHRAYALALFSTLAVRPELAGLLPYLAYRTIGATFADRDRPLALIWQLAHSCAIAQPDAVAGAGFTAKGFDRGEQLFQAICSHPKGVVFTSDRYEDAWEYVHHADGRIHAAVPVLLDELARIAPTEPRYTTPDFPLILSAGERRAFTANVIIRNPRWRRRDRDGALRISPADAGDVGVCTGDLVRVVTATGSAVAAVDVSDVMQQGHISLPNGYGAVYPCADGSDGVVGVPTNDLTSNDRRDRFAGNPWHKTVPARVELLNCPDADPPATGTKEEQLGRPTGARPEQEES